MGDSHTSVLKQGGGLIIRTELIYKYTIYKRIQELRAEKGGLIIHNGLIIRTIR